MQDDLVQVTTRGAVRTVTLNRPAALNSFTGAMHAQLLAALHPWHTVGLIGLGILLAFAVGYLSLGLLFLLPAAYGMFVMGNALLVSR